MNKLLLIALFFIFLYTFIKIGGFIFRVFIFLAIIFIGWKFFNNKIIKQKKRFIGSSDDYDENLSSIIRRGEYRTKINKNRVRGLTH